MEFISDRTAKGVLQIEALIELTKNEPWMLEEYAPQDFK